MKRYPTITQTSAEKKLAGALRSHKLIFKENQYIEGYEIDIWFPECKLAVEVDGFSHLSETQRQLDDQKGRVLMEKGIYLIRFNNQQIREDLRHCIQEIQLILLKIKSFQDQRSINDQWKVVLKNIRCADSGTTTKGDRRSTKQLDARARQSIEDYFLSMDDDTS